MSLAPGVVLAQSETDTPVADFKPIIERMFPKSTVVGDKETDTPIPAWPVYQLSRTLGYAYETKDLVDFPGFSGEQMNFLVGIDTEGNIRGVEVLYHHEPIFMHGLGPQPFVDFLNQYGGHAITEQIVVGRSRGAGPNDVTYIDGVTKATVSVNIANDTVLVSALKLARDRIEAFAQVAASNTSCRTSAGAPWAKASMRSRASFRAETSTVSLAMFTDTVALVTPSK